MARVVTVLLGLSAAGLYLAGNSVGGNVLVLLAGCAELWSWIRVRRSRRLRRESAFIRANTLV